MSGMSRLHFWSELGRISVVEPMLVDEYEKEVHREWLGNPEATPHGQHWHLSFHASAFPGDDQYACGRRAVYGLMGAIGDKPIPARVLAMGDSGKALELEWVKRWARRGVLLTADQTGEDEHQTGFEDSESWLTGSPDAIILPAFWRRGHVVEVKQRSHEKVMAMREGTVGADPKHLFQCGVYVALAHEKPFTPTVWLCAESWRKMRIVDGALVCPEHGEGCEPEVVQLSPPEDGTVIYSSREEPLTTASFYVPYDPDMMSAGREKLAEWREYFLRGEIPPHPREEQRAKWSVDPCQYCPLKGTGKVSLCKADYTAKIQRLEDSHVLKHARAMRPDHDPEAMREAVLKRWGAEEQIPA